MSLFVGREAELESLQGVIQGAGEFGSRQAIAGRPGIGKTTLVQALKARLLEAGYLTTDTLVAVQPGDGSAESFGRVLSALYEIVVANRPHAAHARAMKDTQALVRIARFASRGMNISAFGFGVGASGTETPSTPNDLMIDGPRVLRDLMQLVRGSDARGLVLHVNNLENLSEADARKAADLLRGLRDPMLMHPGLHVLFVGTTDAVNTVINSHAQVSTVFRTLPIQPLGAGEVHQVLQARYEHLRHDPSRPVVPPVRHDTVESLYELLRGDLRGLIKALDEGVTPLLSLSLDIEGDVQPIDEPALRAVLRDRYARELEGKPRADELQVWGEANPEAVHTQKSLERLWSVSQGTVSNTLSSLVSQGLVLQLPRESGREPIPYALSGTAKLIFSPD